MKSYMISSNELCHSQLKKHSVDYALYRDKNDPNYAENAKLFISTCKEHGGVKVFIHQDVDLADELGADGVHLSSEQFNKITYAKAKNLEVIISTHSIDEVKKAQNLGADAVTYSPIFFTPHKGKPKGVEDLKELVKSVDIKVFALGGITGENEIQMIKDIGVYGFASIRYFD